MALAASRADSTLDLFVSSGFIIPWGCTVLYLVEGIISVYPDVLSYTNCTINI